MSRRLLQLVRGTRATAWLTLLAFLLGATPHVNCVCPNGNLKLICIPATLWGCCCASGTCTRSCCRRASSNGQENHIQLRSAACSRSVTAALSLVEKEDQPGLFDQGNACPNYVEPYGSGDLLSGFCPAALSLGDAGPPLDLIVALQRLTI
jgi:hypothetical protein